jgi:hypothetical protein
LKTVQIINLDQSDPDLLCDRLPDLPHGMQTATGQLYNGITPTICGGYFAKYICECNQFVNGTWNLIASMNECKGSFASAVVSSPNKQDDMLVVSGGYSGIHALAAVEVYDGQTWNIKQFVAMPVATSCHCMVKINNTVLYAIGGTKTGDTSSSTQNSYFFNLLENKWTSGPQLGISRSYHSCGIMNWMNPATGIKEKVVVAAGGIAGNSSLLRSVELLFLDKPNSGWVSGTSWATQLCLGFLFSALSLCLFVSMSLNLSASLSLPSISPIPNLTLNMPAC